RSLRCLVQELCSLSRTIEGCCRRRSAGDDLLHRVEISSANETLVFQSGIAKLPFAGTFFLLQLAVRRHAALFVAARQLEHGHIQCVKACQCNELELVAYCAQFALKASDRGVI